MPTISLRDGELARQNITHDQEIEISKMYKRVYRDLQKQLKNIPGDTSSESIKRTYLKGLIKQLDEAYKSLGEGLEKQIKKGAQDASQAVVSNMGDWLPKAGLNVEGAYSHVPKDIVAILSTGQLYGSDWTLSKAIWGESKKHSDDIHKIVATGVAANRSAYDIAKDLEKYVNPSAKKEWDWSKVYPGTSKKVDYNAQRLARTMVSHAYQQSLLATTKHNPFVTGYKWRSAHTHRTCEICNERDGQVYTADTLPLDHPNGMCTFLTELSGSLDDIADRLGDWVNGKEDSEIDRWIDSMGVKVEKFQKYTADSMDKMFRNQQNRTEELVSNVEQWWSKLSQKERDSIRYYTESYYESINKYLRGQRRGNKDIRYWVEGCTSALSKASSPFDMVVGRGSDVQSLRGMLGNPPGFEKAIQSGRGAQYLKKNKDSLVGSVASDSGFLSTSPTEGGGYSGDITYRILVPKGSKGTYVSEFSEFPDEEEFLLQRGGLFRVIDIKPTKGNGASVYMEYLGSDIQ